MKQQVLVIAPYICRPNDGGPAGFIAQNIISHKGGEFVVGNVYKDLHSLSIKNRLLNKIEKKRKMEGGVHYTYPEIFYSDWRRFRQYLRVNQYQNYKYLFFHDLIVLGLCHDMILSNQVVLIQPHGPEMLQDELKRGWGNKLDESTYQWINYICKKAFETSHRIILPDEGSFDIYKPQITDKSKIRYLLSACQDLSHPNCPGIDLDPHYVSFLFVGRRNEIKGFDLILTAFQEAYQIRKELRLYLVGNGDQIVRNGIVDVGFSNKPDLWMKSIDFLVNTNRQSYFDLSIMEAMSVGTRIAMTLTHGHNFFRTFKDDINLIEIRPEVGSVKEFFLGARKPTTKTAISTRNIYESYFTPKAYHKRLDNLLSDLIREYN